MFCAISGQVPSHGVISKKSGQVYERNLIEAYLKEHHTDPVTGEESSTDDLVDMKNKAAVPRAANMTSIPSLLALFQSEWDGVAMETFALKTQLAQTRQQLSVALYENDAAARLLAQMMQERDEARDALAKFSAVPVDEDVAMSEGVPTDIQKEVERAQKSLSAARKKRKVAPSMQPEELKCAIWSSLQTTVEHPDSVFTASADAVIAGGSQGAVLISLVSDTLQENLGPLVDASWQGITPVLMTEGHLQVGESSVAVKGQFIAVHPSGDLLAYANNDGEWGLVRPSESAVICSFRSEQPINGARFHPDGHLLAFASPTAVRLYSSADGAHAADLPGHATAMAFSENGYFMAVGGRKDVHVWDLRSQAIAQTLELEGELGDVCFDHSGTYLAAAGASLRIWQWIKGEKQFTLLASFPQTFQHLAWPAKSPLLALDGQVLRRLCIIK